MSSTTVNQSIKINGSGTAGGGKYEEVKINGSGKVMGDLECQLLKIDGSGKVEGSVKAETVKFNGSASVEGDVHANHMKINGSSAVDGNAVVDELIVNGSGSFKKNVQAQELSVNGTSKIGGRITGGIVKVNGRLRVSESCEVERFRSHGSIDVEGLLSADEIELYIGHESVAKEIGGERIKVKQYSSSGIIKQILKFFMQKNDCLKAETIEGDYIELEVTKAKLVRGKQVIVGEKCEIDRVEYTDSIEIHPNSKVKDSVKI